MVEAMIKAGAITPDEVRETLMDMDPLDSPHGSKAIMVSGFQAIDPVTGKPDETGTPQSPAKPPTETDTVEVGRQALSGSQS